MFSGGPPPDAVVSGSPDWADHRQTEQRGMCWIKSSWCCSLRVSDLLHVWLLCHVRLFVACACCHSDVHWCVRLLNSR